MRPQSVEYFEMGESNQNASEAGGHTGAATDGVEATAVPVVVQVLAWSWIIYGVLAAIGVIVGLAFDQFHLDFGIMGIFIGRGMLQLRRGWWVCAVVLQSLSVAMAVLIVLLALALGLASDTDATFNVFGQPVADAPDWLFASLPVLAVTFMAVWLWLHLRPSARRVMNLPEHAKRRRYMSRPWLAGTIIATIVISGLGVMAYGYHFSRTYYVWRLHQPSEGFDATWEQRWTWGAEDDPNDATPLTSVDVIVEAWLDGELLSESHLRLTYAYEAEPSGDARASNMLLTHLQLEDLSPEPDGRHALISTSGFDPLDGMIAFHLVTDEKEVHHTSGYADAADSNRLSVTRGSTAGPALSLRWSWQATPEPEPLENLDDLLVATHGLNYSSQRPKIFADAQPI